MSRKPRKLGRAKSAAALTKAVRNSVPLLAAPLPKSRPDISSALLKLERAKEHIDNLHATIRAFGNSYPYRVGTKRDPQTRHLHYYLTNTPVIPEKISLISGDAIHCLRCSLDHLAFALFRASGGIGSAKQIYFPISEDAAKFKTETPGKVKGMRQDFIDALGALEPYKGGAGHQLWVLHKLNNIDKHRLLVTVGSMYKSVNVGRLTQRRMLTDAVFREIVKEHPDYPTCHLAPADRMCPLKAGDELLIDAPDAEVHEKMEFTFEIAINESKIVEGEPLVALLSNLAHYVHDILGGFAGLS